MTIRPQDLLIARRAKKHGARYALRIVLEARHAELPLSLAFAVVEQESGFANVFGHDAGAWRPSDGKVTRDSVAELLRRVKARQPSNGVGLTQLTFPPYIHAANRLGGAWKPKYQLRVAFGHLADLIHHYGVRDGLATYNAGEPASIFGRRYAREVLAKSSRWHKRLA